MYCDSIRDRDSDFRFGFYRLSLGESATVCTYSTYTPPYQKSESPPAGLFCLFPPSGSGTWTEMAVWLELCHEGGGRLKDPDSRFPDA